MALTFHAVILFCTLIFVSSVSLVHCASVCHEPGPNSIPSDTNILLSPQQSSYEEGMLLVYKCLDTGYGYVSITCREDTFWSPPSRGCTDTTEFSASSGIGLLFALLNIGIVIIVMMLSTRQHRKQNYTKQGSTTTDTDSRNTASRLSSRNDTEYGGSVAYTTSGGGAGENGLARAQIN